MLTTLSGSQRSGEILPIAAYMLLATLVLADLQECGVLKRCFQ